MTERPNWGWGSNDPVPVFTETEIRETMACHHETGPHVCSCSFYNKLSSDYTPDHFIEELKENHYKEHAHG